jgi:hypothetical protein
VFTSRCHDTWQEILSSLVSSKPYLLATTNSPKKTKKLVCGCKGLIRYRSCLYNVGMQIYVYKLIKRIAYKELILIGTLNFVLDSPGLVVVTNTPPNIIVLIIYFASINASTINLY